MPDTTLKFTISADVSGMVNATKQASDGLQGIADKAGQVSVRGATASEVFGASIKNWIEHPLQSAQGALIGFIDKIGPAGLALGGIVTAVAAAGAALFSFVANAADAQEQLDNLSAITGISVQDLQALKQIAKEAGLEALDLGSVISRLNKELGSEASGQFEKGLKQLGISTKDVNGIEKDAITLLDEVGAKLRAIPDKAQQAAEANAVLGGRYRELIPLVLNTNTSLRDQMQVMKDSGVATDELTQNKLRRFDEMMDKLSRESLGLKTKLVELAAGLAEVLIPIIETLAKVLEVAISAILKAGEAVGGAIASFLEWAGVIETVESQYKKWVSELDPLF